MIFGRGEISRPQSNHKKAIQEMRPKPSLQELVCGELTLKTGRNMMKSSGCKLTGCVGGTVKSPY